MRIAEFDSYDDAVAFLRFKGRDYSLIGGINLPFAVAPKPTRAIYVGREEPPELVTDEEAEYEDYYYQNLGDED